MNKQTLKTKLINIGSRQVNLLEKLSNAIGVSGEEDEIRKIILNEIAPYIASHRIDALGNLIATCSTTGKNPLRVLIAAHMDEVGFMIVDEDEGGFYRFDHIGGIDARLLAGKPVIVGKAHVPGVIGVKPIHLTTEAERKTPFSMDAMRIDCGPDQAKKIEPGERATYATKFHRQQNSIMGKAMDNRIGVATLIELIKNGPYPVELTAAFTVQEEVGLRGARVAAYSVDPDVAIAVDSTPALDYPVWDGEENTQYNTKLDQGPALYTGDMGTMNDPRLISFLLQMAEAYRIPCQLRQPGGGGTDAGAMHKVRAGVPAISISTPHRGIHAPVQISRVSDWQNTMQLLQVFLLNFKKSLLAVDR